jgi:hypothetical protein
LFVVYFHNEHDFGKLITLIIKKNSRSKHTWAEGIRGMMGEKGLKEEGWTNRSNWREKNI